MGDLNNLSRVAVLAFFLESGLRKKWNSDEKGSLAASPEGEEANLSLKEAGSSGVATYLSGIRRSLLVQMSYEM